MDIGIWNSHLSKLLWVLHGQFLRKYEVFGMTSGISMLHTTGWWFQIFFMFIPIWGTFPFRLIFFKGVETTNYSINGLELWAMIRPFFSVGLEPATDHLPTSWDILYIAKPLGQGVWLSVHIGTPGVLKRESWCIVCHVLSKNFPTYPLNIPQTQNQQFMKEFLHLGVWGGLGYAPGGMLGFS